MKNYLEEIGFVLVLLFLALLLVFSLFWALSIGTVKLPIREIYETVLAQFTSGEPITAPGQGPVHDIVWLLRLPCVILASLVGCGLAVCGVIMQAIVKNPLADPYTLYIRHFFRRITGSDVGDSLGHWRFAGAEFCGDRGIYRRLCDFAGGAFHIESGRALKFDEAASCRHGTFGGVRGVFQLYCIFCE